MRSVSLHPSVFPLLGSSYACALLFSSARPFFESQIAQGIRSLNTNARSRCPITHSADPRKAYNFRRRFGRRPADPHAAAHVREQGVAARVQKLTRTLAHLAGATHWRPTLRNSTAKRYQYSLVATYAPTYDMLPLHEFVSSRCPF